MSTFCSTRCSACYTCSCLLSWVIVVIVLSFTDLVELSKLAKIRILIFQPDDRPYSFIFSDFVFLFQAGCCTCTARSKYEAKDNSNTSPPVDGLIDTTRPWSIFWLNLYLFVPISIQYYQFGKFFVVVIIMNYLMLSLSDDEYRVTSHPTWYSFYTTERQ